MIYYYIRVSTTGQDIARQEQALKDFQEQENILVPLSNVFVDHYSGRTFDRVEYQKLKAQLKQNDYLIVKEIDRLGRNWDLILKEWRELKEKNINIIVLDMPILSDPLPSQKNYIDGLDMRLIKEQILSLMCYSAQKEREKISRRTKEGLQARKEKGVILGRPKSETSNEKMYVEVLRYMVENKVGIIKACEWLDVPKSSFQKWLKQVNEITQEKDYKKIIDIIEQQEKENATN